MSFVVHRGCHNVDIKNMNNIAVLFAGNVTEYAFMPAGGGASAFERAVQSASELPGVKKITVLGTEDTPRGNTWDVVSRPEWTAAGLLEALDGCCDGFVDVFFYHADCPLMDTSLSRRMYDDHREYFAEYTFADGYPAGLTPEILKKKILKPLIGLAGGDPSAVTRDTLFRIIQRDINAFDIETKISPVDLRLLRVSLTCDTRRNRLLVERVIKAGGRDEKSILSVLQERADLLRTLPAYAGVQITDAYPQRVSYLPPEYYPSVGGTGKVMPAENLIQAVKALSGFAGDLTVGLSYRGDPSMYARLRGAVEGILDIPDTRILLETSGIRWAEDILGDILSLTGDRITWIVELDARDEGLYRRLRGDGFREAYRTAERLVSAAPEAVYLQAVRMKENEEDLEQFYRYWKESTENVIIKKYDHFCGLLPQEKVTDLSPLKRFPCRHIMRDMYILADGTVPMCGEDLGPLRILGNVFSDPVEKIWEKGGGVYGSHAAGDYPSICAECDEYYTFNF